MGPNFRVVTNDVRFYFSLFYEDSGEPAVGSTQPEMSACGNGEVTEGGASAELATSVKPETSGGYFGIRPFRPGVLRSILRYGK